MDKHVPIDDFDKINFLVSVILMGCGPSFSALFRFAKEPAYDMLMYILIPDLEDLVKEWLRPGTPRKRKPARHGKKRDYADMLTDPYGQVNGRAKAKLGGAFPGVALPGMGVLFRATDVVDRVNNSAFILEGITEIGFRSMLGAINLGNQGCDHVAYVHRTKDTWSVMGGAGGLNATINYGTLLGAQNFFSTGPGSFRYLHGPWRLSASANFTAYTSTGLRDFSIVIRDSNTAEILASSGKVNLEVGESAQLSVSAELPPNQGAYVGIDYTSGFAEVHSGEALAWGDPLW